ncbi:hypothetical protein MHYP_G00342020 [Metynnis hypsauchen]
MACMSTDYNQNLRFSGYSQTYEFRTSVSIDTVLKILTPILCIILIIFISTTFCCYIKMKRELWDTYPTPKITSSFKNQIDILLPFENEFSPIHVENSSLELIGKKTWSTSSQADVSRKHHNHQRIRSSVHSASGVHAQVHSGGVGQDKVTVNATVSKLETSMSYSALENQSRATVTVNSTSGTGQDSGNSSGLLSFSNKCYFDAGFSSFPPTLLRKRIYSLLQQTLLLSQCPTKFITVYDQTKQTLKSKGNVGITLTHFWNHIRRVPPFCTSLLRMTIHSRLCLKTWIQ